MGYRQDNKQTRRQNGRFTISEWISFRERLKEIEKSDISERDYKILNEIIVNQKTTEELAFLGRHDKEYEWVKSNQKKPMSVRRIQQILHQYYPEFHIQTTHKKVKTEKQIIREEQRKIKLDIELPKRCGRCGSTENLELHHLFPVSLGGTNDKRNLLFLCKACHQLQSIYCQERLRELGKEDAHEEG